MNCYLFIPQNHRDAEMLLKRIDLESDIRESLEQRGWKKCNLSSKYNSLIPSYDLDDLRDWCGGSYAMSLA